MTEKIVPQNDKKNSAFRMTEKIVPQNDKKIIPQNDRRVVQNDRGNPLSS